MSRVKLTDKQKKKILADYIDNNNYSETARMNNTSKQTVMRLVNENKGTKLEQKLTQKKEENTKDILEYMEDVKEQQREIIDLSLKALKEKLNNVDAFTSVKDIATAYGIMYDKAIKAKELKLREDELAFKQSADKDTLNKLDQLLEAQHNAYMD